MNSASSIYSNAFNFEDFVRGGVDVRTGMYTFGVSLGEIMSGNMNGPSLPIQLQYNPVNAFDSGFGVGWALSLTRYDVLKKFLSLSSGEQYKASESASALTFNELKLKTLTVSKPAAGRYNIVHKSGVREELSVYGSSNIAVPTRIVAANGTFVTLTYKSINGVPVLSEVRDTQRVLLSITRNASVKLTLYPGTDCEAAFTLSQTSAQVKVGLPMGGEWVLGLQQIGGLNCVTSVESPLGGRETIRYKVVGHLLPPMGPMNSIPCVSAHVSNPRFDQPSITKNYQFSDANFLGRGAGINWTSEGDNLYRASSSYTYTSTERLMVGEQIHSFIVRTYNKFHLLLSQITTCADAVTTEKTEYHLLPGANLAGQPAQFRMPKVQTTVYENRKTGAKSLPRVTRTEHDEWGNLLKTVEPSGVTAISEYYPATASDGCPADPLGFVRFEKQRTVSPASGFASAATTITRYRYGLQNPVAGATVPSIVPLNEQFLEFDGKSETARSQTDLEYFNTPNDPSRHGLLRKQVVTQQGKSTRYEFAYTLKAATLELQTSQIGFDGTLRTSLRTVSALNGVTKSERNEDDGTVVFQHDSLGRLLSETVASGTAYAATQSTSYTLANGNITPSRTLSTDVNGLRQQVTYDGLGRTIRIEEQDADSQSNGPLRTVYSARYNVVGQLIEEIRTDWMQGVPLTQKTDLVFDDWGQLKTTLHADGRKEHIVFDPVALREERWQEGMGKKITVHNLFGKPQSVEAFDIKGVSLGKTLNEYDGMGRSVSQTDPVGNRTVFQYDVFNRLQRSILPDGHAVDTEYASHSQEQLPVEVKVAGRSLGQQTFDGLGRLIQSKVGGRVTTAGYEAGFSQPAWEQTPGGRVEYRYERNLGGRVTQRSTTGLLASYTYHPKLGLPTQSTEGGRKSHFEYYPSGRLKAETSTLGAREEKALYTYSLGGRPLTCTDVFGHQHKTTYDQHGRPKSFEQNALKATFAYNTLGQLATVNAQDTAGQSSLVTRLTYDDLGRETSRIFEVAGTGTQTLTSSYTLASKLARKTLKSGNITLRDELFSYDKRGRLDQYTCSGSLRPRDPHGKEIIKQTYAFDAMDNIVTLETEFPGGKNITSYTYNTIDPTQLIGIRHSHKDYPAAVTLQYDASGQLIKDEQARRLTYDALGRLTQVANAVGAVVRGYHYDAQDRLVELSQPAGPVTQRYYCEGRVLNETRGQDKRTCLRIGDALLGQHKRQGQHDETKLVGTDQQQSVLTEVSSGQRRDIAYSPYGHRPAEGGLFSLLGFSGEQLDPLTGLYLLGNGTRAYSPTLMRFLSPDTMSPFGAGGLNPYMYCAGDPINRVDPTGHFWKALLGIGLAIAGFALSVVTMGAATPLAAVGIAMAGASASLGVTSIIANEVAPESGVGKALGWASLATGALSAAAGLAALGKSAAQWGSKLVNAYKHGLSGKGGQAAGKEMARGMAKGKGAKAAAKALRNGDKVDDTPKKWTVSGPKEKNIKPDLGKSQMDEYDTFRKAIADEGLSPVEASKKMGDSKYTLLNKKTGQYEVRIGGKDRVTFLVKDTDRIVEILQVGGHT